MMERENSDAAVTRGLAAVTTAERWAVASEIASKGRSALTTARRLLTEDEQERRIFGAEIFGRVPVLDEHAVGVAVGELTTALSDSRDDVKVAAALNLARLPTVDLAAKLMALRYDMRNGVRIAFAIAVQIESDNAIDALVELARDQDAEVRSWSVFRLSELDEVPSRVLDVLVECAADESANVRADSIVTLALDPSQVLERRKNPVKQIVNSS